MLSRSRDLLASEYLNLWYPRAILVEAEINQNDTIASAINGIFDSSRKANTVCPVENAEEHAVLKRRAECASGLVHRA
jgi:hypothetical protein